jgi:hypothetical protein
MQRMGGWRRREEPVQAGHRQQELQQGEPPEEHLQIGHRQQELQQGEPPEEHYQLGERQQVHY